MTTRVTTNEVQVLKRTWLDLDPKVRNALDVWVLTVALVIGGLVLKTITPLDAGYLLVPVTLAVGTAYVTTSKHRQLIINGIQDVAPVVEKVAESLAQSRSWQGSAAKLATAAVSEVEHAMAYPVETEEDAQHAEEHAATQVLPSAGAAFFAARNGGAPIVTADTH